MAKEQKTMMETLQGEVCASWNKASSRLAAVLAVLIMVGLPLVFQDYPSGEILVLLRRGDRSGSYLCDHGCYILEQGQKVVRWSIAERLKKQFIS